MILIPIAHGSEEIEAVTVIDILRRGGLNLRIAGENEIITCSRGVKIIPDILIENIEFDTEYEAIVLPGGSIGVQNLIDNDHLHEILKRHYEKEGLIAAICAAPTMLASHKLLKEGVRLTSHPSVRQQLESYNYVEENVVEDENLITSRGAGTAVEFALTILSRMTGRDNSLKIAKDIVYI